MLDLRRTARKIAVMLDNEDNKEVALQKKEWQEKRAIEKLSEITEKEDNDVRSIIKELMNDIPEVKGCMVISYSGEYICSVMEQLPEAKLKDEDIRNFAAFIERYLEQLERDESFEYSIGKFSGGYTFMRRGHNFILMLVTTPDIRLGLILSDMNRILSKIDNIIE